MLTYSPSAVAPYFIVRSGTLTSDPTNNLQFLTGNANRVAIMMGASGFGASIFPAQAPPGSQGYTIPVGALPFVLKFSDVGALVGGDWYLLQATGAVLLWTEVIYNPPSR